MSPAFTVTLRGQSFVLTKAQIESDAPNYFTASFLGGYQESTNGTLTLDRNPALFALIVEHLSGYVLLPLPANAVPGMSNQAALRNLRADALFYGLERLQALLSAPVVYSPLGEAVVTSHLYVSKKTSTNHSLNLMTVCQGFQTPQRLPRTIKNSFQVSNHQRDDL